MHICQEEIMALLATVPALRYLVAWLIRQRAVRVWWTRSDGQVQQSKHCASCHEEIEETECQK